MDSMSHAKNELQIILNNCEGVDAKEMQQHINNDILEVLAVLCKQGHSNTSAHYIINKIKDLWLFKPLTDLSGDDNEWDEVGSDTYQNKRYSAVFKHGKYGRAYFWMGMFIVSQIVTHILLVANQENI